MRRIVFACVITLGLLSGCKSANGPAPESVPSSTASQPSAVQGAPPVAEPAVRASRPGGGGTSGQFDFYLFVLSWSPEFCLTHGQDAECKQHLGYTVHGLWPQNNNGTYPEHCGSQPGPTNPASWSDVMPDPSLVAHEWTTHGTCSGLAADAYFGQIRKAFHEVAIPAPLNTVAPGTMLTPAVILGDLATANPSFPKGSFALSCGSNRLTAVEVCLSKTLQPIACSKVKTCGATVVKITPRAAK